MLGQSFGSGVRVPATSYLNGFLNDYLGADYDVAGDQFLAVTGDQTDYVFQRFSNLALAGTSGQSGYPDMYALHTANVHAKVAFRYSNQKTAGTYCDGLPGKSVFLGFGMEQVQVVAVRRQIMNRIIDYFDGLLEVGIEDRRTPQPLLLYPNPAGGTVRVLGAFKPGQTLAICDLSGRQLLTQPVIDEEDIVLNTAALPPGLYQINYIQKGRVTAQGRLAVTR